MHIIKLHIQGSNVGCDEFFEHIEYYFHSLYQSTQITNEEWQYEPIENGVSVNLYCPEQDSFHSTNSTIYANRWKAQLEDEFMCTFNFNYVGVDPSAGNILIPESPRFLILKMGRYSPLIDGDSCEPIPLYKIPDTHHNGKGYNNINFWENNYKRVRELWFNGAVGESWCQAQLQEHDSELSEQGIDCAKKIEEVTKLPTYYFLFNYREETEETGRQRKCPGCGGDWMLEEKIVDDLYAFKCDACRLVAMKSSNT